LLPTTNIYEDAFITPENESRLWVRRLRRD
jgi:hypothetical protein